MLVSVSGSFLLIHFKYLSALSGGSVITTDIILLFLRKFKVSLSLFSKASKSVLGLWSALGLLETSFQLKSQSFPPYSKRTISGLCLNTSSLSLLTPLIIVFPNLAVFWMIPLNLLLEGLCNYLLKLHTYFFLHQK